MNGTTLLVFFANFSYFLSQATFPKRHHIGGNEFNTIALTQYAKRDKESAFD